MQHVVMRAQDRQTMPETQREAGRLWAVNRLASWKVWSALTVLFVASAWALFQLETPFSIPTVEALCGAPPPDVQFASSTGTVERFLASCGTEGRTAYRNMLVADAIYPAVFAMFMASSLALAVTKLARRRTAWVLVAVVPMIGAGLDYLENALEWRALEAYPSRAASTQILAFASAAKTITFWLAGAGLIVVLVCLLARAATAPWRGRRADMMV